MATHLAVVELLPLVCEYRPDDSAGILDDHLPRLYILGAVEPKAVDFRLKHANVLLVRLLKVTVAHRHGKVRGGLHPEGVRERERRGGGRRGREKGWVGENECEREGRE